MALQNSKLVIVKAVILIKILTNNICFHLQKKFLNYLKKRGVFTEIINDRIENKNFKIKNKLYFICSKKKFFPMKKNLKNRSFSLIIFNNININYSFKNELKLKKIKSINLLKNK